VASGQEVVFLSVLGGILGGDGLTRGGEVLVRWVGSCGLMAWWVLGDGAANRCELWLFWENIFGQQTLGCDKY
jgi:hypothetical protein